MDVEHRVRQFIIDELRWVHSEAELTPDYPLIGNDVLDSMAIFQLIAFLEDRFAIQVADEELILENFETIGSIARFVAAKADT